jgi:hypothetical protein
MDYSPTKAKSGAQRTFGGKVKQTEVKLYIPVNAQEL